jgi:beta-mannosidase
MFIFSSFILLFSGSNSTRVSLIGDDWSVSNGQTLQAIGTVPGTVHTILLSAELIDEPYWGFGDTTMRQLVFDSWTFTKKFSLQGDFLNLTQFTLHFDQIDTVSNVTLNQCFLGNTSSIFFAYTFNILSTCLKNDNILRVDFMSPVIYALNQAIAYNKTVQPTCPGSAQHGECHVQFIRKEPCSFSWDWVSSRDGLNRVKTGRKKQTSRLQFLLFPPKVKLIIKIVNKYKNVRTFFIST